MSYAGGGRLMKTMPFGTKIVVRAETVRVIGKPGPAWRQASSARDYGRFVKHDFSNADDWPGQPVPELWDPPTARQFQLEPALEREVFARLRRLPTGIPEIGIVLGVTHRQEGTVRPAKGDDDEAQLTGPGRTIDVYEVALAPTHAKARIVMVHPRDATLLPDGGA